MKSQTIIWASFKSVGHPESNRQLHGTVKELTMELAKWLLGVTMGSRIDIRFARRKDELDAVMSREAETLADISNLFDELAAESEDATA